MKCYNCNSNLIVDIDYNNNNIDTHKIATKYKEYDLCNACFDNLVNIGFLGDADNPTLEYVKEKVSIDTSKLLKIGKKKKGKKGKK